MKRSALMLLNNLIDDAVLKRLLGIHPEVTLGVMGDLLGSLAGVLDQHLFEPIAHPDDFTRLDERIFKRQAPGKFNVFAFLAHTDERDSSPSDWHVLSAGCPLPVGP